MTDYHCPSWCSFTKAEHADRLEQEDGIPWHSGADRIGPPRLPRTGGQRWRAWLTGSTLPGGRMDPEDPFAVTVDAADVMSPDETEELARALLDLVATLRASMVT